MDRPNGKEKKYKSRYDWVGKVIHWAMCKTLHFYHDKNGICAQQNQPDGMKPIISEWSNLAQKAYMSRYDWVGNVSHWKLRKQYIFTTQTKGKYTKQNQSKGMKHMK